jgi:hypothetical protein
MTRADDLFAACGQPNSIKISELRDYAKEIEQSLLDAQADTVAVENDNAVLRVLLEDSWVLADARLARINELQRNISEPEEQQP